MTALLGAAAAAVLLAPNTRPSVRLRALAGDRRRQQRHLPRGALVGAACCLAALLLWGTSAALATTMITATVGWQLSRRRRRRDAIRVSDALLTALSVMIAELSVGAHPAHACRQAAEEMATSGSADPGWAVAEMLRRMAGRAELGGDVADGIVADGVDDTTIGRLAVAWRTSERHGLPMADLLSAVRDDLVARRRAGNRTRAALAGARATAMVLSALPLLGIGLGQAIGADPVATLLGGGLGGILLVVGTALVIAGQLWSERIVDKVAAL